MKLFSKLFIASLLIIASLVSNAQGINFQGVARSANGTIIASSNISLRLSIISKNVDATPEYVETKTVVTNAQGIFTVVVGDATNATVVGSFKTINWSESPKFLKVEMDPAAGTNYINMGATQLQYVPYSYYSLGVAAENVTGVLPVTKGGTGVSTLANLRTALNITAGIDTTSLSNRIDKVDSKIGAINISSVANDITVNGLNIGLGSGAKELNTIIGNSALKNNTTGNSNTVVGWHSLMNNTTGSLNSTLGQESLMNNKTGSRNIALGYQSLANNVGTSGNIAIGYYAMHLINSNATDLNSENLAIGSEALKGSAVTANNTGYSNVALGSFSLRYNASGSNNTGVGLSALETNTTGYNNTSVGIQTMRTNTTGTYNVAIGSNADVATNNLNNATAIGSGAIVSASNSIQLGNTSVTDVKTSGAITASGFKIPNGTSAQYLRADGTVTTSVTSGVPYTGASQAVDLGPYDMNVNGLTVGIGSGNASATINTAVGYDVLNSNTTGSQNTAVGYKALNSNTTGFGNTALGLESLLSNTTGYNNTSVGKMVLKYNTSGINNIGMGWAALQANTTGNSNIGIGGLSLVQNTTGDNNVSLGHKSLYLNTAGDGNTSIGFQSLYQNSIGSNNVAIGYESLKANTTGSNNTAVGKDAMSSSLTYSNSSAIGFNAQVNASNQIQLGNTEVVEVKTSGVVSSAKGFLPPRLSSTERDAIISLHTGLIVFCNNCGIKGQMQYYDGSAWVDMVGNVGVSGLNIGSSFQGGKIAYILQVGDPGYDPDRLHGIISSTVDQTNASYSGYFAGTGVMWQQGTYSVNTTIFDVTNASGTALGTGRNNTDLIIAKQASTGRPFAAAAIAVAYNGGGYSDWFLPSKDELSKLYLNRSLIGGFEANWYWSSSEKNDAYAEALNFATGNFDGIGGYKGPAGTPYKVRAVRYF